MGYRHLLQAIPKKEIAEIQKCKSNKDLVDFIKDNTSYTCYGDLVPLYYIGTEIYDLGKYSAIGFKLQSEKQSIFSSEELKEMYSDYGAVLLQKEDFKEIIEWYKQKIVAYFNTLLNPPMSSFHSELTDDERHLMFLKLKVEQKIEDWSGKYGFTPVNLDENSSSITDDWSYEYAIFELVRLYKFFDWEKDDLVLMGM